MGCLLDMTSYRGSRGVGTLQYLHWSRESECMLLLDMHEKLSKTRISTNQSNIFMIMALITVQ